MPLALQGQTRNPKQIVNLITSVTSITKNWRWKIVQWFIKLLLQVHRKLRKIITYLGLKLAFPTTSIWHLWLVQCHIRFDVIRMSHITRHPNSMQASSCPCVGGVSDLTGMENGYSQIRHYYFSWGAKLTKSILFCHIGQDIQSHMSY